MNTAEVIYQGDLRTKALHINSSSTIITDAPLDNSGKGEAFSPTDLVATSLASCAITVMGIMAKNHNIDIKGARATVVKHMESNPRRISQIDLVITMPQVKYTDKERSMLEHTAFTCPVAKSLSADLVQNITFVWHD
jgi:uncharacterized OsmC-like protein